MMINDFVKSTFMFVKAELTTYYFDDNGLVKQQTEEKLFNELSAGQDKTCSTWSALLKVRPELNWKNYANLNCDVSFIDLIKNDSKLLVTLEVYYTFFRQMVVIWRSKNMMGAGFAIKRWSTMECALQILINNAFTHCC